MCVVRVKLSWCGMWVKLHKVSRTTTNTKCSTVLSSTQDIPSLKEIKELGSLANYLHAHRYVFLSYISSFVVVGE